ncbi:MAG: FG-GAP repeat protein [Planctomycetes bacterium]|nr:FG-GAP repeat protein [Planctomycetota bacterium]
MASRVALAAVLLVASACRTRTAGAPDVAPATAFAPEPAGRRVPSLFGMHVGAVADLDGDAAEDLAVGDPDAGGTAEGALHFYSSRTGAYLGSIAGRGADDVIGTLFTELPRFGEEGLPMLVVVARGCLWTGRGNHDVWNQSSSQLLACDPQRLAWSPRSWTAPPGERVFALVAASAPDGEPTDDVVATLVGMRESVSVGRVVRIDIRRGLLEWGCAPPRVGRAFGEVLALVADSNDDGVHEIFTTQNESMGVCGYLLDGASGTVLTRAILEESTWCTALSSCRAADVDRDGMPEVAIAISDAGDVSTTPRSVLLVSPRTLAIVGRIEAPTEEERTGSMQFGFSMSAVPDLDGDGEVELLIASRTNGLQPLRGRARVFASTDGSVLHEWSANGGFGWSCAVLRDARCPSAWRAAVSAFVIEYPALGERVELLDASRPSQSVLRAPGFVARPVR